MSRIPEVECLGCGRRATCMRMRDDTVYRPFAWKYPNEGDLRGVCGDCQCRAEATALIERVKNCKTVEEYEAVRASIPGLGSDTPCQARWAGGPRCSEPDGHDGDHVFRDVAVVGDEHRTSKATAIKPGERVRIRHGTGWADPGRTGTVLGERPHGFTGVAFDDAQVGGPNLVESQVDTNALDLVSPSSGYAYDRPTVDAIRAWLHAAPDGVETNDARDRISGKTLDRLADDIAAHFGGAR